MLFATKWLVYPLMAILLGVSLYLVPSWQVGSMVSAPMPSVGDLAMSVWMVIPVLVFAFSFAAAISQFSVAMRSQYGSDAPAKASSVMLRTTILLVVCSMGFVWSCVFALGPDGLAAARESNLPVLSYLANVHDSAFISYLGPAVAVVAIVSSFFGHYLGAAEGAAGIVRGVADSRGARLDDRLLRWAVAGFIFVTTWAAAVANPSILSLIETLSGPIIASVLHLMPMIAIRRVPALAPYRGRLSNVFVTVAGLVAVSGILLSIVP